MLIFRNIFQKHKDKHIKGGSDEIDGDKLDIDFTPTEYAPSTSPSEVDDVDHLSAHLAGIDTALGSLGGGSANYTEDRVYVSPSLYGAWVTRTLSGDANKVVHILIDNYNKNNATAGVRAYGSSLDRKFRIGQRTSVIYTVKLDSQGRFQIYGNKNTLTFYKIGEFS